MTRSWLLTAFASTAAVLLLFVPPAAPAAAPPDWVARWRADLAVVADSLPRFHANLFHTLSREAFRAELDSLSERVPGLDHHEIAVELARIVVRIGDGHTRLTLPFDSTAGFFTGHTPTPPPLVPGLVFHHLPLRFGLFADGLYVVRAIPEHRALLGGRIVTLGRLPVDRAMAAVEPTVQHDNDQQLRDLLPTWLVVPEILHARGVTEDKDRVLIVVETGHGTRREAVVTPARPGVAPKWLEARDPGELPLAEQQPAERHWFRKIAEGSVLYARYREVYDDENQTIAEFAEEVFGALGGGGAKYLIVDVRGNPGGNGFLNRPLVHGAIASPALERPGSLFVLADRGSFSAAIMLLADLEKHTPAVIVGEKTGGDPNSYGDSRRLRLPNSGLTIRASTLYWQLTGPQDPRDGITPHVAIEPRFADWKARRDPVLDSTLSLTRAGSDPAGEWAGTLGVGFERIPMAMSVARVGGAWTVRLDAPALRVAGEPATEVRFEAGELRFARRSQNPVLEFRGRVAPDAIVGVARFLGARVPFVLSRKRG